MTGSVTSEVKEAENFGVPVAADESCRCISDAKRIAEGNLADVINIKLAKSGAVGALEIIEMAIASGLHLMIGGMIKIRLAMGFAGHLAAGMGNSIQNSELENLHNRAHPSLRQQVSNKQVPSLLQLCATFVFYHFNALQTPQHKSCGCPCHEKISIKL
ncbi:L-Ala-D/L-amino acid epimerase-like protein [Drosera capensis]